MSKINCLTLLLFVTILQVSYSQDNDSLESELILDTLIDISWIYDIEVTTEQIVISCPYTVENAIKDIKNNSPKLVVQIGFTGPRIINQTKSTAFQKKYNVNFEYLGCIRGWNIEDEDVPGYNETILAHLSKKYGNQVREEFKAIKN